jgi:hypothetical protein
MEIEMLKLIGNALNMSWDIESFASDMSIVSAGNQTKVKEHKVHPLILVGWFPGVNPTFDHASEYTLSYLTAHLVWYTPCAVKFER